jgi:hypothetical protein
MTPKSSDYGRVFFQAEVFRAGRLAERRPRPSDTIIERARQVPVFRDCDVLVAGGGPSGTAAARAGADTVLVERHNHLGGLSTGDLVIWIDRMTDWSGRRVIEGIAAELIDRLPAEAVAGPPRADWGSADTATAAYWKERTAAFHGIVAWSPTIDPENLKLLSQELVVGAGVHLILHAWASTPAIEEDGRVGGIVFESKEGRLAIRAKVTIDCTGDGDIFHRAGAVSDSDIDERDIHHCINTAWLFRRSRHAALDRVQDRRSGRLQELHGAWPRGVRRALRAAVRVVARRCRAVHGTAAGRLFGGRCRGPD